MFGLIGAELSMAIRREEEAIRKLRNQLAPDELLEIDRNLVKCRRSYVIAFLLCMMMGLHLSYLNDFKGQLIFWLTCGGFGIWWLLEGWVLPKRVRFYNLRLLHQRLIDVLSEKQNTDPALESQTILLKRDIHY